MVIGRTIETARPCSIAPTRQRQFITNLDIPQCALQYLLLFQRNVSERRNRMSKSELNVEQVLRLHNLTKDVSQFFERQLRGYLDAVAPLFRPRRILSDYI